MQQYNTKAYQKTKRKQFNDWMVTNPYMRKWVKFYYHTPNPLKPHVSISNEYEEVLTKFRETGVVKIPGNFGAIADYINETYLAAAEGKKQLKDKFMISTLNDRGRDMGKEVAAKITFNDAQLDPLFFDENLCGLLYNFYKRQPYYRNQPVLVKHRFKETSKMDIQGKYHLDNGLDQVNFMFLLNDLTENDTHMEFASGSVKQEVTLTKLNRFSFKDEDIAKQYPIEHLIGPKGTLWMFNAGNGYHRAVYKLNTTRNILHWIVTPGHTLDGDKYESKDLYERLSSQPAFVRNMVKKLI